MQISFKLWLFHSKETVPGTHSTGTWAGHKAGLDDLEEIIISCLLSQIEPQFLGQPVVTVNECDISPPLYNWYRGVKRPGSETTLTAFWCRCWQSNYTSARRTSLWRVTRFCSALLTFTILCNTKLQHLNYTGSDV